MPIEIVKWLQVFPFTHFWDTFFHFNFLLNIRILQWILAMAFFHLRRLFRWRKGMHGGESSWSSCGRFLLNLYGIECKTVIYLMESGCVVVFNILCSYADKNCVQRDTPLDIEHQTLGSNVSTCQRLERCMPQKHPTVINSSCANIYHS